MGPGLTANYSSSAGDRGGPKEELRFKSVAMFCAAAEEAARLPGVAV